jgi:hypothetical protein
MARLTHGHGQGKEHKQSGTEFFIYNFYSHKEKKIQCRYESPREEAREGHG